MSYRPLTDVWILGRCKHKYYGGYPAGFLHRGRAFIAHIDTPILHVCGGKIRDYPYRGLGKWDKTLDLDPALNPDYLRDANLPLPYRPTVRLDGDRTQQYVDANGPDVDHALWDGIMIDRPYTEEDADHYAPGRDVLPPANLLVKNAINAVKIGATVGILDYAWPHCPKNATEIAVIAVTCGRNNRMRQYTVFERRS